MKKFLKLTLITVMLLTALLSVNVAAKVGDVVGEAQNTDIVAYINNYAIPSYAVNGQSCIVAEDLRCFGFDVVWNDQSRTLTITKSPEPYMAEMDFIKTLDRGSFFANVLQTDIVTYAGGIKISSYAINGYTMVPMEELTMLGQVTWKPDEWVLDMTVEGFPVRETRQEIKFTFIKDSVFSLYDQPYSLIKSIYGKPEDSMYYNGGVAFQYPGIVFFFDNTYDLVPEPKLDAKCKHIYTLVSECIAGMEMQASSVGEFERFIGETLMKSYDEMDEMYVYSFYYKGTICKIYVEREGIIAYNDLVIIQDRYKI